MIPSRPDAAAWAALDALYAEGWYYRAEVSATRAQLALSRGSVCSIESADTLAAALARCAVVLGLTDHPAVRAATVPASEVSR